MVGAFRRAEDRCTTVVARGRHATDSPPDQTADVKLLGYFDVCLVLATAPFVLVAGMPLLGYLVGACAWLLTRFGAAFAHERAYRAGDPKVKAGLYVAGMMGRVWVVALAVILARYAGGKDDGIMAAGLVLAAFTVYFVMSLITREGPLSGRPRTGGRPRTS
jgi:hypothetical protein